MDNLFRLGFEHFAPKYGNFAKNSNVHNSILEVDIDTVQKLLLSARRPLKVW